MTILVIRTDELASKVKLPEVLNTGDNFVDIIEGGNNGVDVATFNSDVLFGPEVG